MECDRGAATGTFKIPGEVVITVSGNDGTELAQDVNVLSQKGRACNARETVPHSH